MADKNYSPRSTYRAVSSAARMLRHNGASYFQASYLARAANLLFSQGDYAAARLAKRLDGDQRIDGLGRFPVDGLYTPISAAYTFARHRGWLCPGVLNLDGLRFQRLTGRLPASRFDRVGGVL